MAAGTLAKPTAHPTSYGPCLLKCNHTDCAATRKIAASICKFCEGPIAYEIRFYRDPDNDYSTPQDGIVLAYVHALCFEIDIENELKETK